MKVCIFGTGSLGANVAVNLARRWADSLTFVLVDYDVIEEVNLANQPWYDVNIGQKKISVLASHLYRIAKSESICIHKKVTAGGSFCQEFGHQLKDIDLFIDCFDNMTSRNLTQSIARRLKVPILHAGFSETAFLAAWENNYPLNAKASNRRPVCDRRDLVTLVVIGSGLTEGIATNFFKSGEKISYFMDIAVNNVMVMKREL